MKINEHVDIYGLEKILNSTLPQTRWKIVEGNLVILQGATVKAFGILEKMNGEKPDFLVSSKVRDVLTREEFQEKISKVQEKYVERTEKMSNEHIFSQALSVIEELVEQNEENKQEIQSLKTALGEQVQNAKEIIEQTGKTINDNMESTAKLNQGVLEGIFNNIVGKTDKYNPELINQQMQEIKIEQQNQATLQETRKSELTGIANTAKNDLQSSIDGINNQLKELGPVITVMKGMITAAQKQG